jgi:hypothetical protein
LLLGIGLSAATGLAAAACVVPEGVRIPSFALAFLIALGTLIAAEPLLRSATMRGIGLLGATWAVALLLAGAWLLPATEPYRLAPKVAAQLKDLCSREHATPLLATFQPPAVVYHFGRPIRVRQDNAWLAEFVRRNGSVAMALTGREIRLMLRDPRLALNVRETVTGFNVERARNETLFLALLRPSPQFATTVTSPREHTRQR